MPEQVPPAPVLPVGVRASTRYSLTYPTGLRQMTVPPVIVHLAGDLPARLVTVVGADYASAAGVEVAGFSALAAQRAGASVCAVTSTELGLAALRTAVDTELPAVAVIPHGMNAPTQHQWLLDSILSAGGAVVSFLPLEATTSFSTISTAHRVAAALGDVVLVAEVGVTEAEGSEAVAAAIFLSRPLVVPVNNHVIREGGHVPSTAAGSYLLAREGADVESAFGPGTRVRERAAALLPAADYTPESLPELLDALAAALLDSRLG